MRIVSLLPSATEIVAALGAIDELVGISHECDFPAGVQDHPVLTRSRIDPHARSGEIDQAVPSVVADALSLYTLDEELLAKARPDVIITQDLCEVCAVSLDDVRAAVARLIHREDVRVVSLHPTRLGDAWDDVVRVADAIERPAEGRRVRQELHERIQELATRASALGQRPRVVSIEWLDPVMLGGTWMPELIAIAGGTAVGAQAEDVADRLRQYLQWSGVTRAALFADPKDPTRKRISWHDLRATGITWRAVRGDEPFSIQWAAGHSDVSTTQIYIREVQVVHAKFGEVFGALPEHVVDGRDR